MVDSAPDRPTTRDRPTGADPDGDAEANPNTLARAICLRLLSERPRTRSQLADALAARRVPSSAAEAVLDRFTEVGLIDDAAFAQAWVSTRQRGRGLARRALRAELRQRGVDRSVVEEALGQVGAEEEAAAARELARRRLAALAGLPPPVQMRRLLGLLSRRGYSPGLAQQVVREVVERPPPAYET
jgi:regulatory protein